MTAFCPKNLEQNSGNALHGHMHQIWTFSEAGVHVLNLEKVDGFACNLSYRQR